MIEIPSNIVTDVATATTGTFDALGLLIAFMISVPLAFYVTRRIIALFPKSRSR